MLHNNLHAYLFENSGKNYLSLILKYEYNTTGNTMFLMYRNNYGN